MIVWLIFIINGFWVQCELREVTIVVFFVIISTLNNLNNFFQSHSERGLIGIFGDLDGICELIISKTIFQKNFQLSSPNSELIKLVISETKLMYMFQWVATVISESISNLYVPAYTGYRYPPSPARQQTDKNINIRELLLQKRLSCCSPVLRESSHRWLALDQRDQVLHLAHRVHPLRRSILIIQMIWVISVRPSRLAYVQNIFVLIKLIAGI